MTQAVQNPMAGWEPNLHPRDSHGRFRDKWGLPEAAKKLISGILKNWNSPSFKSDAHAQAYLDQQAKKKKRSPQTQAAIDYFMSEPGNEDIQSTLRANAVGKLYPQIEAIDEAMVPLDHDLILTRVLGPDAFGLPPERIGEVEEWTGKLLTDLGYQPTNAGTPHPVSGPHITMSILAPHGTRAVVPGDSRAVILDREQPLRVTKVEPDGHGGLFMYAVVAPEQGNKEASRSLGKELAPGELSPAIEATPEELAKRGLDPEGNPIPPGGMAPAAAPVAAPGPAPNSSPSAPTPAKMTQVEPATPLAGPSTDVHQKKIDDLKAKIEADKAAGKEPAKEDVKALANAEGQLKAEPPAPEPAPIEGPDSKPAFKDKNLEPGPEHPDKVAKKQAAKAAQQETAKAEAPAAAAATVDELINKKATNQTIAQHLRSIASGPQLDGIDDEGDRDAVREDLERAADAFQDDNPLEGKKIIRSLSRATGVEMQGKAGEKVDYDPSVHDAVNPEGLKAGDKVEVIKAGATMRRKDGSLVHLDRAIVKRSSDAASSPEAPKTPEKKTSFGAPKISRAERLDALKDVKVPKKAAKKAAKKAVKAASAFNEKDLGKNTVVSLRAHAKEKGIKVPPGSRKADIIDLIQDQHVTTAEVNLPEPEVSAPGAPVPKKLLSAPTGKFGVADDPGDSGDGYSPSGKWGHYGAAGALIRAPGEDGAARYLLVQRGPGVKSDKGKWQLPGGALNSKENAYQGASREISEEVRAGDDYLKKLEPVGEHVFDDGSGWKYTTIAARADSTFDPHVDGTETGDAKWLTEAEIRQMAADGQLTPATNKSLLHLIDEHEAAAPKPAVAKKAAPAAKKAAPTPAVKKAAPAKKVAPPKPVLTPEQELNKKLVKDLRAMAEEKGIKIPPGSRKADIIKYLTGELTPPKIEPKPEKSKPKTLDQLKAEVVDKGLIIPSGATKAKLQEILDDHAAGKKQDLSLKSFASYKAEVAKKLKAEYGVSLADAGIPEADLMKAYDNQGGKAFDAHWKEAVRNFEFEAKDGLNAKTTYELKALAQQEGFYVPYYNPPKTIKAWADYIRKERKEKIQAEKDAKEWHAAQTKAKEEKQKAEAAAKGVDVAMITRDYSSLVQVGPQGGSNPGGIFEAPDGTRYYIKTQKSEEHARNEQIATSFYRELGIEAPEVFIGGGAPGLPEGTQTATKLVPDPQRDLRDRLKAGDEKYLARIYEGFGLDAWLANWDTAGQNFDNIVSSNGQPIRIDSGGSLLYRAQGQPKGSAFGPVVTEWETYRNKDSDFTIAQMYAGMTHEQAQASVEKLRQLTPQRIRKMVQEHYLPESLANTLIQRRSDLLSRASGIPEFDFEAKHGPGEVRSSADATWSSIKQFLESHGLADESSSILDALETYQGSGYGTINQHLLSDKKQNNDYAQSLVDRIDKVMSRSRMTHDSIVYRGVTSPERLFPPGVWSETGGMEGMEWEQRSYSSTSAEEKTAASFSGMMNAKSAVLRIRVPKGAHALYLGQDSSHASEEELLIARGARFRIVADHGVQDGARRLDVELVLPDEK